jgi:DNA (cytosine-5)-methyltransferase 1
VSLTITDLFCGAGGSSIGAEMAGGELRLGLNHWDRAVETHATNFPDADHDAADVSATDPRRYRPTDLLLASPECTNHSLAKGGRRRKPQAGSLFDDGPAGDAEQDRSRATMWDVVRFGEAMLTRGKPYKAIIVENVVDAAKWGPNDDGSLFDAWLLAMRALGYEHEIVWLNSMFCPPTPQSRDRMYVVFWRKGIRRPNLQVTPTSWCPHCEEIVSGRQTWKRPDRRLWGRYGAQYFFTCPDCHKTVLPGAFPAASAIDWALPAERIGDRKRPLASATRERIRRGLERLSTEPFAIRLTHGGTPRPLTLPLVTLTRRHDMGVVLPVSGNRSERTPGSRADFAHERPLRTVETRDNRALIVPPMGSVDPRDADTQPGPTQTTTTRAAVVHLRGLAQVQRNGDVRDADMEPVHTVRAGGQHHAVVLSNRANNVPRKAADEPTHPVLTGEHLGVVIRNNTPRGDAGQMATPPHEPFRTFTASCTQSLVVPYARGNEPGAAQREPASTLTTRDRLALVVPAGGTWARDATGAGEPLPTQTATEARAIAWGDDDIDACRFRMFALHEIASAMVMHDHVDGSPYIVLGNKRERMAQYGNAVTPPAMRFLVGRVLAALDEGGRAS